MQPETRQVHLADLVSFIETRENALDLVDLIRPDLAPIAFSVPPRPRPRLRFDRQRAPGHVLAGISKR
jgi:hypothetical protein